MGMQAGQCSFVSPWTASVPYPQTSWPHRRSHRGQKPFWERTCAHRLRSFRPRLPLCRLESNPSAGESPLRSSELVNGMEVPDEPDADVSIQSLDRDSQATGGRSDFLHSGRRRSLRDDYRAFGRAVITTFGIAILLCMVDVVLAYIILVIGSFHSCAELFGMNSGLRRLGAASVMFVKWVGRLVQNQWLSLRREIREKFLD